MKRIFALSLAATLSVVALSSFSTPAAAIDIRGLKNTIIGRDNKADEKVKADSSGDKNSGGNGKGRPNVVDRVSGDKPARPMVGVSPNGPCLNNGFSSFQQDSGNINNLVLQPCPNPVTGKPAVKPPPSPRDAAFQAWYWETTLPDPTLATSPPNGAITGLDLYLAIGGPQNLTFDVPALGYMVHLDVSSVYDVNWGDPKPDDSATGRAITRNHPTQGGLYPVGDLRHQYIDRGEVTIEVVQKWTGRWSAGGESGVIADRLASSATRTVKIEEIQAIITG